MTRPGAKHEKGHNNSLLTDTGPEKKSARGLCVPFVDISLRASFYSASHFSKEIRAQKFAWPFKRHTVLYRLKDQFGKSSTGDHKERKPVTQFYKKNLLPVL